jgi:3-hydroxyisobutyrate dehydrogenase-like beta-hydroxyacid dehydrogenase
MGAPMALNMLKHGVELSVFNRTKEKAHPLINAGAKLLDTPSQAFEYSPIVFSMLANDEALNDVVEGKNGLLESAYEGCVHVSFSTVSPDTTKNLSDKHQEKGTLLVAATVFGRPEVAAKQELRVCVAGDKEAKNRVMPFLEMVGKGIFDFGTKPESANVVKMSGNFMIASVIEMLAEAFAVVEKRGVDPQQFLSLMTETLFPSPVFKTYGEILLRRQFDPAGFAMPLGLKDVNLFLSSAEACGLNVPFAQLLRKQFLASLEQGRETMDWSAISLLIQDKK